MLTSGGFFIFVALRLFARVVLRQSKNHLASLMLTTTGKSTLMILGPHSKKQKMQFLLLIFLIVFYLPCEAIAASSQERYGRVIIGNFSPNAGMAKVIFDHWLHRARFTCRVCHVDIGFAMERGGTRMKASENMRGSYCGTCHNGKMLTYDGPVFSSCSIPANPNKMELCDSCHSLGKDIQKKYDFTSFSDKMPKSIFGNGIDWVEAERAQLISPKDYVQGVPVRKQAMLSQKDFSLESKTSWMGDIVFSHKKHTMWNGCEGCHPEIFIGVNRGSTKYNMFQIYQGEYCGVCHLKVAFPLQNCPRCHTKPVK